MNPSGTYFVTASVTELNQFKNILQARRLFPESLYHLLMIQTYDQEVVIEYGLCCD